MAFTRPVPGARRPVTWQCEPGHSGSPDRRPVSAQAPAAPAGTGFIRRRRGRAVDEPTSLPGTSPGLGLRARTSIAFALGALVLSVVLSVLTYQLTRTYLTSQREELAARQAYLNARLLRDVLRASGGEVSDTLSSLATEAGSQIVVRHEGRWLGSAVTSGEELIPADVRALVQEGQPARRRAVIGGEHRLVVGTPLPSVGAWYFETFPLDELNDTLRTLAVSLAVSATITTLAGAAVGQYASRRVLRPLRDTAAVAAEIGRGQLDSRLPEARDPDLSPLSRSFNAMVAALEDRIEREQRFASDVSHELRTPLTALSSAVAVLDRQAPELPERAQTALSILTTQVVYFQALVLDLLEISRLDAGAEHLELEPIHLAEYLRRLVDLRPEPRPRLVVDDELPERVAVDRRRLERVLVNLLDNADRYGEGARLLRADRVGDRLVLAVEDGGAGVPVAERERVFERFYRGMAAHSSGRKGTGLGLSLAAEQVRLHGGELRVEDAPGGGARFVADLPLRDAAEELGVLGEEW
ncbi:MAG: HAMP domain-containing protein [Acidimicrobiia bacterium]|nr:HAMP domain-containing protein [Acidimicrobiia bacterium]